jgi:predicted HD phosphohydrolase
VTRISDVDSLFAVLADGVRDDDGEGLDLLAHSLQCATNLAASTPEDLELQVAGLVHDLGTILEPGHPDSHARTGGDAVRDLLGARIADLVTQHDQAKRYLVSADPEYRARLSPQSVVTLGAQGGAFDARQRADFEALPDFASYVTLRRADDAAKRPGRQVPELDTWRTVVEDCAAVRRR